MEWILLVLAAAVLVFGIGVVLWNRRRSAGQVGAPAATPLPARPAPAVRPAPDVEAEPEPAAEAPDLEAEPEPAAPAAPAAERPTFRSRMSKARSALAGAFLGIRGRRGITDETWDDLEEALLRADVGVRVTDELLGGLKARVKAKEITEPDALLDALQAEMTSRLAGADRTLHFQPGEPDSPNVWLFVGVNGVGKTTTIGKLASRLKEEGKEVILAAGDTFRAAAVPQLEVWGRRVGCPVVKGKGKADPASVIFDAVKQAQDVGADIVIADTAGRLHTKSNLMEELKKVARSGEKALGRPVDEVLLVLDSTTGQNAIQQAAQFKEAIEVSGIALTKLDGTAKGGVILGIVDEHGLPVHYIGVGERVEDLREFDAATFVQALFAKPDEEHAAA